MCYTEWVSYLLLWPPALFMKRRSQVRWPWLSMYTAESPVPPSSSPRGAPAFPVVEPGPTGNLCLRHGVSDPKQGAGGKKKHSLCTVYAVASALKYNERWRAYLALASLFIKCVSCKKGKRGATGYLRGNRRRRECDLILGQTGRGWWGSVWRCYMLYMGMGTQ